MAGSADVAKAALAWVDTLVQRHISAGVDVTARYYDGARHELFTETNRDEVVADLIAWLDGAVPGEPTVARSGSDAR